MNRCGVKGRISMDGENHLEQWNQKKLVVEGMINH